MDGSLIVVFTMLGLTLFIAFLGTVEENRKESHKNSLRIGKKVRIKSGYFAREIGEVVDYVPTTAVSYGVRRNEGFTVLVNGKEHWFSPENLELVEGVA